MAKQRWFVAVLVLQSRVGLQDEDPIVDHQVRLIRATNARVAHDRALRIGAAENQVHKNRDGENVTWEFLGLSQLDVLDEAQLDDGGEVYSWLTQGPGAAFVRSKAELAVFKARTKKTAGESPEE
jgi:hypothetical protein